MNTTYTPGPVDEQLRLEAAGTTKAASFAGTALDQGVGFGPTNNGQPMAAVINPTARDTADGNETYAAAVQESVDGATWVTISPSVPITATRTVSIPVFVSARFVRVSLTLGGTTPSITYQAWLVPIQ